MLSRFPHLTTLEFESACSKLIARFHQHSHKQDDWQSADLLCQHEIKYLRITRPLVPAGIPSIGNSIADQAHDDDDDDGDELSQDDNDEEALQVIPRLHTIVHYDILLSPVYQVPVLYVSISDTLHRFPPTMSTLYDHLIPRHFKAQAESGGVIGGITIHDHPITSRPVFFVHPCQTVEVMEASVDKRDITAEEYLILWIGALGKCVGLNVPLALMQQEQA